jgi:signal transduction histidine kinase
VAIDITLFLAGGLLALLTLMDVFQTVVVPGGSKASLRVARRLVWVLLPVWKAVRGKRHGLSGAFAPLILVLSFIIWMSLLMAGFGFMAYALRHRFDPPLESIFEGMYVAGSSLVTVGVSEENALGPARWILLGSGFCGLAVMTMAVTYLLEVQSSVGKRDIGIIKLNTSAGEPPSAVTLLKRFAAIGNKDELAQVLREGRDWCATVRQSHSNHPSLIYFQSASTGTGWPGALGALLDVALLSEHCIDDGSLRGAAVLLRDEGTRMARELAAVISLHPSEVEGDEPEVVQAVEQIREAGYPIRADADLRRVAEQRSVYWSCVKALADHLGKPTAVLVRQE